MSAVPNGHLQTTMESTMPHAPASRDRGDARAAVAAVIIARTREQLCEACAAAPVVARPTALSLRVDGTDLFVITPDTADLAAVGPAQTSLADLDGRLVSAAWDRRTRASAATAEHAGAHRTMQAPAVASRDGRVVHAQTPAAALEAVADPGDTAPPNESSRTPHHP